MGVRQQIARVIVKNSAIFLVASLVFLLLVTSAQWSVTKYKMGDIFYGNLVMIKEHREYFMKEMQKLGMNETEYAWYLTYRQLNIKPTFEGTMRYYLRSSFSIFGAVEQRSVFSGFGHSIWYYLRNTVVILLIVELVVLSLGTYLGLKAGYKGGRMDVIVSGLAQLFSAIPVWFIGALLFLLAWRFSIVPDFTMRIQLSSGGFSGLVEGYAVGFILPALTMILASIWEYAFTLRNIVVGELGGDYITYDRARGFPENRIMKKLLRVVFPSFLTYTTYNFMDILMSVLIVEIIFDVPGLGYVLLNSFKVVNKPPHGVEFVYYPQAVFAVGFFMILLYYINSLLADVVYFYLDPRVSRR